MVIDFRAPRWQEEELAKRLAKLMYGDERVFQARTAGRWQIGDANDCWLHRTGPETFRLVYRYPTDLHMTALAVVMEWLVGVEVIKDADPSPSP